MGLFSFTCFLLSTSLFFSSFFIILIFFIMNVTSTIDIATNKTLDRPNWEYVLKVVDHINANPDNSIIAAQQLQKRLKSTSIRVKWLTVILIESCMKNCNIRFQEEVASPDFTKSLLSAIKSVKKKKKRKKKERKRKQ